MIIEGDTIWIRQSWLDNFMRCPNRGRLEILHPEAGTSDSAALGTGAHAAIEAFLLGRDPIQALIDAIDEEVELGIKWTHPEGMFPQNVQQMYDLAQGCFKAWLKEIFPQLEANGWLGATPEQKFEEILFELPDGRKVGITGTADLPTLENVIVDWKTSKRKYKQYDKQMHAIQPSIYAWAATRGGFEGKHYEWPLTFVYGVMIRPEKDMGGAFSTELVPVRRTEAHARWAMKQIQAALTMALTVGLDVEWPMVAEGNWLCSRKWCNSYDRCRGQVLSPSDDVRVAL